MVIAPVDCCSTYCKRKLTMSYLHRVNYCSPLPPPLSHFILPLLFSLSRSLPQSLCIYIYIFLYLSLFTSLPPVAVIEKFTENVRFCLICNYLSKIIPALQSRCTRFRFGPLSQEQMIPRLQYVIQQERCVCVYCPPLPVGSFAELIGLTHVNVWG